MIPKEELEKEFPYPILFRMNCTKDFFLEKMFDPIHEMMDAYNEKSPYHIEKIIFNIEDDIGNDDLDEYVYEVLIGGEPVFRSEFYDCTMEDTETQEEEMKNVELQKQQLEEYIFMIPFVLENIIDENLDWIINCQDSNREKVSRYAYEEYDEMLFGFFNLYDYSNQRIHLKKLAQRYPNSEYARMYEKQYLYEFSGKKKEKRRRKRRKLDRF